MVRYRKLQILFISIGLSALAVVLLGLMLLLLNKLG